MPQSDMDSRFRGNDGEGRLQRCRVNPIAMRGPFSNRHPRESGDPFAHLPQNSMDSSVRGNDGKDEALRFRDSFQ
jgi:hypothetical protein